MKDRGSFIGLFIVQAFCHTVSLKKGENWIALGNQNELRVESLEKEFGAIQHSVYRIPNGQDR